MDKLTRLALAARNGDEPKIREFIEASAPEVWRLCAALADVDSADDLTQETYARACVALPRFRGEASARTWLLSIARRVVADTIRKRARTRRLEATLQAHSARAESVASSTGEVEIRLLIAALPQERREAFVLTQLHGLSYEEAADVCGCPIGTIRSRVARARENLLEWLSDEARSVP
ncbi:sigma-70 family RNA polymerase sigma factor [Actinomadura spongiicola]|uniref:Sigma-70 family RNA polymerase sigma factor n=1 Tax=Actinomadura spongiicola TaxID=2303421 RepID=A0A372G6P5_9ACTN|nr:sigma-70 family RNA polymerase sigma factor [Actinomadura spongiicola]RFS80967.1 sigma-70 family RNA polymerase sigma factor [Actinomadura spongiicola]